MNTRDTQFDSQGTVTRRGFLGTVAAASGGAMIPQMLFLSGNDRAAMAQSTAPMSGERSVREHTLRATSYLGAPDGRQREIWGYNGQLPGPVIRATEGETLRVRVINELKVPTSVHWHGMHQPGTWQMDGVEGVSRPPIEPGAEFTYEFNATPAGTHWYHSHTGLQYGDGLLGPLIIDERTPIAQYDREEILIINDWFKESGDTLLAQILEKGTHKMSGKMDMGGKKDIADVPFQSGLINGRGRASGMSAPLTEMRVKRGAVIRLRLINACSTFALRFQVDNHALKVIATDGQPIAPVEVDNLVLVNGERYDVLLQANSGGVHWIRAATLDGNEILAVFRYVDAAGGMPEASPAQWGPRALTVEQLHSPKAVTLANNPREIVLTLGGSMMPYRWSINDQVYPNADPIELAKDEVVRFVLRNPTGMDHPFHLHGQSFWVLGKPDALNTTDPALKDTINVPANSEVVIQWVADNPGKWFFHCHIEWHLATGMARVIEIR